MEDITAIREHAGLVLPTTARLVTFQQETVGEQLIKAKLILSPNAFAEFLASNHIEEKQFSAARHGFLGVDDGAWDPSSHPPFPVYAKAGPSGTYLYVGYRDDAGDVALYIFWFMT